MRKLLSLLAACLTLALLAPAAPVGAKESPTYVAIGDSLAFGVGASDPTSGGYVALTHDSLRKSERYRDRGLELVSLAIPGATSSDLLLPDGQLELAVTEIRERQEDTSSADDNVEIITVNVGGNDVVTLAADDSPCLADPLSSECQDLAAELLATLEDNLTQVLRGLREAAPKAQIIVLDLYSPFSGRGGAVELVSQAAIGEINAVTARVTSDPELAVSLAGIQALFSGRAFQLIADDNVHPNDQGHAVMAEVVLATIEGREPDLPEALTRRSAAEEGIETSLGEGGLLPVGENADDGGTSLLLLLAVLVPVSLLGLAAVAGAYRAASGR